MIERIIDNAAREMKIDRVDIRRRNMVAPEDMPFKVGRRTELRGMSAEVVAIDTDGQPTQVLFEFTVSLDDPSLVWFQWTWENGLGSYSRFKIPAIGEENQTNGPFGDI